MTVEIPAYAQLQREMHNALLAQHPEWILPNGDCPTCDSYDARFAELLFQSLQHHGSRLHGFAVVVTLRRLQLVEVRRNEQVIDHAVNFLSAMAHVFTFANCASIVASNVSSG